MRDDTGRSLAPWLPHSQSWLSWTNRQDLGPSVDAKGSEWPTSRHPTLSTHHGCSVSFKISAFSSIQVLQPPCSSKTATIRTISSAPTLRQAHSTNYLLSLHNNSARWMRVTLILQWGKSGARRVTLSPSLGWISKSMLLLCSLPSSIHGAVR